MTEYMQSLPDGWTIYLWIIAAAGIIFWAIYAIHWAYKHGQFDEDIKYLVFDENDRDKMDPKEFAKAQAVLKDQMAKRELEISKEQAKKAEKHAQR